MLGLGLVQQLRHAGACTHIERVGRADTIVCHSQKETQHHIEDYIAHRWRGRVVVSRIMIGCVDVGWILHFTLHTYVSHRLRDGLPMDPFPEVTNYMSVLTYNTHG